jgi:transcriptional regulator with XRE-family HTH domain
MSPSTLSRLETGRRRMAIDHLVTLARALGTTVDELVAEERVEDVVIRPRRDKSGGRVVTKMRIPKYGPEYTRATIGSSSSAERCACNSATGRCSFAQAKRQASTP